LLREGYLFRRGGLTYRNVGGIGAADRAGATTVQSVLLEVVEAATLLRLGACRGRWRCFAGRRTLRDHGGPRTACGLRLAGRGLSEAFAATQGRPGGLSREQAAVVRKARVHRTARVLHVARFHVETRTAIGIKAGERTVPVRSAAAAATCAGRALVDRAASPAVARARRHDQHPSVSNDSTQSSTLSTRTAPTRGFPGIACGGAPEDTTAEGIEVGEVSQALRGPSLPSPTLAVPDGNRLAFWFDAVGVQIYVTQSGCRARERICFPIVTCVASRTSLAGRRDLEEIWTGRFLFCDRWCRTRKIGGCVVDEWTLGRPPSGKRIA
jgi:hypothetical protein